MQTLFRKLSSKAGLPPGELIYVGQHRTEQPTITVIDYDERNLRETQVATPNECRKYLGESTVTWINLTGLHDPEIMRQMGEVFGIDALVLEDIINTGQRPRSEDMGDYIFITLKMLYRSAQNDSVVAEQVSIILGKNYVLSFQEVEGDVFEIIRRRIRSEKGRIRKMGCDYLAYSLIDAVVDHYFVILEDMEDRIEIIQDAVTEKATSETVQDIHEMKREMIFMRKNLWPLRELVGALDKSESDLIRKTLSPYLRDVYEHTIQVIDTVESLRDMLSGALDIYMTTVSNRMNEIMKMLTVIATIFIPLTFIAGIYGMNFENMPELKWRFGYVGALSGMFVVAAAMILYFKRKKWL
ncbi:MAG: magnesium/cobalt transporter CorA [Lentisphaerae bacterium]|nr:magnesium/cobalt transporter CorA [Lentisphaerota bacterium]